MSAAEEFCIERERRKEFAGNIHRDTQSSLNLHIILITTTTIQKQQSGLVCQTVCTADNVAGQEGLSRQTNRFNDGFNDGATQELAAIKRRRKAAQWPVCLASFTDAVVPHTH